MVTKKLRVKPEEIAFLQFLIEGYEGIGTLTTLVPQRGVVQFAIPEGLLADAEEALRLIGRDITLEEIPADPV
jgi:hypothetical protein